MSNREELGQCRTVAVWIGEHGGQWRATVMGSGMNELQLLLQQVAERAAAIEMAAGQCGWCFHPRHEGEVCGHTRTVEDGGVEVDGPCGCQGEGVGYGQG